VAREQIVRLQPRIRGLAVPLAYQQVAQFSCVYGRADGLSERCCDIGMRISGALDIDLLRKALNFLIARHESLRTRFVLQNGVPNQQIDVCGEIALEEIDQSAHSSTEASREVSRLCEDFVSEKVSLSIGPLFAAKLFKLPHHEYVLMLAIDHIITDGVSNDILYNELWTLYRQGVKGLPLSLPPLPLQFADYAVWQQGNRDTRMLAYEKYWRERLNDRRCGAIISDDSSQGLGRCHRMLEAPLGSKLSNRLRDFAQRERTLLPLVVFAVYISLLSRFFRRNDLRVSFSSSGRVRLELMRTVGPFANNLYLKIRVLETDSFLSLLAQVRTEFRSAYEHQNIGFFPDDSSKCQIQAGFNWLAQYAASRLHELEQGVDDDFTVHPFRLDKLSLGTTMPLWSVLLDTPSGIVLNLIYCTDLFPADTVSSLSQDLILLAEGLTQSPRACIPDIAAAVLNKRLGGAS